MPNTIKLGKRPIELVYTFPAFEAMETSFGLNAMRPSTFGNFSPATGATLVWGGQLHTTKPLTRSAILKLMPTDTDAYYAMMKVVSAALKLALGDSPTEPNGEKS